MVFVTNVMEIRFLVFSKKGREILTSAYKVISKVDKSRKDIVQDSINSDLLVMNVKAG